MRLRRCVLDHGQTIRLVHATAAYGGERATRELASPQLSNVQQLNAAAFKVTSMPSVTCRASGQRRRYAGGGDAKEEAIDDSDVNAEALTAAERAKVINAN